MSKKKEECQGCIGFSDEHTCDGYADFLAMKAEKDKCSSCQRLTAKCNQRRDDLKQARDILDERFKRIAELEAEVSALTANDTIRGIELKRLHADNERLRAVEKHARAMLNGAGEEAVYRLRKALQQSDDKAEGE